MRIIKKLLKSVIAAICGLFVALTIPHVATKSNMSEAALSCGLIVSIVVVTFLLKEGK